MAILTKDQGVGIQFVVPPENIIVRFFCSLFTITFVLQVSRSDGVGHRLGVTQQCYPPPAVQQFEIQADLCSTIPEQLVRH
jgi:hypothetical protein